MLAFIQFSFSIALSTPSLAQGWKVRVKPRGTLGVVDLGLHGQSVKLNSTECLITKDKDNNWVPCLAEDWRQIDDRTIEFKLREGVRFHNGERFNAETVRINWEAYRKMKFPWGMKHCEIPDETEFEIIDEYMARFTLPRRDGLVMIKFWSSAQFAPAFFSEHRFDEYNWGYLREAGPWGTGPFKLVEGGVALFGASDRVVLEAFENYWDRRYPKVQKVIFDNRLIGDRKTAMRIR
jgi:peptide/nickel transport system substrate-binding protein